jgi:plastocyanin
MADSLVLSGVKHIKKQTGTEMVRRFPKGGGDVFRLKRWWVEGGVSTVNTNATVFDVTTNAGTVKLAIESSVSTNLRIQHDGSFNFTFTGINEVGRAALYTENFELIEHYVFPSISGGKIMTVVPPNPGTRPESGGGFVEEPDAPDDITVVIDSTNGTDGYNLTGDVAGENATINIEEGGVLTITNNTGGHPLYIKTAASTGTGDQVTEGTVTGQGATSGSVVWDTTGVTPGTYYYQCSSHAAMNGEIVVA